MKAKHFLWILILGMLLMSGCSKNKSKDEGTSVVTETKDEKKQADREEKKGEEKRILTIGTMGETTNLSPLYMIPANQATSKFIYEGLVKYVDGEIVPCLAEKYTLSEDGKTLTFHLRKGVKFHDGEEFNAAAALANIEFWHTNPAYVSLPGIVHYTSIEATDDYTIVLQYESPYYAYLRDFCWPDVCVMVSPKIIHADDFQTVHGYAGTGPYVYDEYVAGKYTKFVRNEEYWGEKPQFDEIIAKYIPEASSRLKALEKGEIDLIYGAVQVSYDDYMYGKQKEHLDGAVAPKGTFVRNLTLNFNGNLRELPVRQAVAYAIDKQEISEGLTYGIEPIAETMITEGTEYSNIRSDMAYTHDPEKATELLEEAGWKLNPSTSIREKDGAPLHVVFTYPTEDVSAKFIAEVIKSQLAKVGIDLELKGLEKMEWYMGFLSPDGFDITCMNSFYDYAMPHCWYSAMMAQMPQDVSIPLLDQTEEFQAKLKAFKTSDSKEELMEIFSFLIKTDLDQVLDIPLTYQKDMILFNKDKIAGYKFQSDLQFFDPAFVEWK